MLDYIYYFLSKIAFINKKLDERSTFGRSAVGNPHSIEALFTTVVVLVFDAIMNFDFTVQQKSNFEPEVIILTNMNFFFLISFSFIYILTQKISLTNLR